MSADSTHSCSEGRYYIATGTTRVTVTYTDAEGQFHEFHGQLADLSLSGFRIDLDGRVELGSEINLRIEVPSEAITIDRSAIVRWQQPRDTQSWWTGCEVEKVLEGEIVERLAMAHVLNRRRDPRYDVDKPALARTELSNTTYDVRLVNYSKGGFCLLFDEPMKFPHERLMLTITPNDEELTITARVMWTAKIGGSYGVGCAFSDRDGFVPLRDYVAPNSRCYRLLGRRVTTVSSWIAISLAITIVLQAGWLMRTKPELGDAIRSGWAAWVVQPIRDRLHPSDASELDTTPDRAG